MRLDERDGELGELGLERGGQARLRELEHGVDVGGGGGGEGPLVDDVGVPVDRVLVRDLGDDDAALDVLAAGGLAGPLDGELAVVDGDESAESVMRSVGERQSVSQLSLSLS